MKHHKCPAKTTVRIPITPVRRKKAGVRRDAMVNKLCPVKLIYSFPAQAYL
jgi:hypothetical protein